MNTLTYLKSQVDSILPTNGIKSITAATLRPFLKNILDGVFTPAGTVRIWAGYTIPSGWSLCDGSELSQTTYADLFTNLGGNQSPYGVLSTTFKIPLIAPAQTVIQYGIASFIGGYSIQDDTAYTVGNILTSETPIGGIAATFKVLSQDVSNGNIELQILTNGKGYITGGRYNLSGGTGTGAQILINSAYDLGSAGGEEKHFLSIAEMPSHYHNVSGNLYSETGPPYNNKIASGINGSVEATFSISSSSTGSGTDHNNMPPFIAMNYIIKLF